MKKLQLELLAMDIEGTISFAHHAGRNQGEDMVWPEGRGRQVSFLSSEAFEQAGRHAGAKVSATVAAEPGERVCMKDDVSWSKSISRLNC